MYNIEELTKVIREKLSDYRFYHSVCVAESAKELAERYGADVNKAETAGILHDATKESTAEEQLEFIKKAGISISDFEIKHKKFYHQISGAAFAKAELGIEDEEILNAIRYHTTGRDNMTLLEEIIYLADFISADRTYDDIENIRNETEKGKEYGLLYATRYTIKSVADRGDALHPDTVNAYNYLLEKYFND
ncbi:MAG: bis(5'-nucleosyl)-tetraphosphatase (symmetrical) YqeK [Acetobacter sp.]|nr:bis(5'-nucleosyl)-tetraphosphatase (symmetrical) YqeK [Bacteroides sp.]MCM1340719.1 bis(5'-nucleosyl)-tetraphosphatase (symmetrical) YqeK [Acetobacter sp.]MCM1433057.1 bis(5'-nucleosyl)-tetraphosphatase (symmetrical) YqeK [Clostridiales bacterium]